MNHTPHRLMALPTLIVQRGTSFALSLFATFGLTALGSSAAAQVFESYRFTTNRLLPDGDPAGLADVRKLDSAITSIASVKVHLNIAGEFNGDVYAYLAHADGFCVLLNRVGRTAEKGAGYADYGFDVSFALEAENGDIHKYQEVAAPKPGEPLTGWWVPDGRIADPDEVTADNAREESLKSFMGSSAAGDWTLYLVDLETGGTNQLAEWGLELSGVATPSMQWSSPASITYGTALSATQLNATVTYLGTNVPGTLVYAPASGTVLNAGNQQTLSVTFTPSDPSSFETLTSTVTIDVIPSPLTITATSTNKIYGAALPAFTASYSGFVNGDSAVDLDAPVTLVTSATNSSPVGSYPIAASDAADANYSISFVSGTLTVDTAVVTVTVQSATKVYGANLPGFTASYSGFVNGDNAGDLTSLATFATTATALSTVGNYPITASGATSANYSFNYVDGSLTITQALTEVALVSSQTPAATGSNITLTASLSPVAPGAGTPTGAVNFRIDGAIAGTQTLTAGTATLSIKNLSHGLHTIVAEYAGDVNFVGSTNALAGDQMINTAPVAGSDTIERYATQNVKVRLSTLLANDSDVDTDALSITVSSVSLNGATISVSDDWVTYTPVDGFTNTDSFTYTITDGFGGSTVGTVTVAIKVDNDPGQSLTITDLGNGSVLILGNGIPGRRYHLEYSDASGPFKWQPLPGARVTTGTNGVFEWTDTGVSGSRFYRSVYP